MLFAHLMDHCDVKFKRNVSNVSKLIDLQVLDLTFIVCADVNRLNCDSVVELNVF